MDQNPQAPSEGYQLGIQKIKTLSFGIDESAIKPDAPVILKAYLEPNLAFSTEAKLVEFKLRVEYRYEDKTPVLAHITVQNIFVIPDLEKYLAKPSLLILPELVIISIVGSSISHTRALFSQYLLGTALQDSIVTLLDPADVARHYFPYMFGSSVSTSPQASN